MDSLRGGGICGSFSGRRLGLAVGVLLAVVTGIVVEVGAVEAASVPMTVVAQTRVSVCTTVSLRTSASSSSTRQGSVGLGTTVTVAGMVTGGRWSIACGGRTAAGSSWYRVTRVNGKAVASLYGPSQVYAATGLFKSATVTVAAACDGAVLRTGPSTGSPRVAAAKLGTLATVTATVKASAWSVACGGTKVSASTWYRITGVGSRSATDAYGVSTLYAATGLFKPVTIPTDQPQTGLPASPLPTPNDTPEPSPTADRSTNPMPTPTPMAAPNPMPIPSPATTTTTASCDSLLFASTSQAALGTAGIPSGAVVTVANTVAGEAWSGACADPLVQGSTWLHVIAVNGTPVSTLFGIADLYAIPAAFAPLATPPLVTGPGIPGISVSYHQGTINWSQVAAAGIQFAYIKSTEGTQYVDPAWTTNRANAVAAGLRIGAFHYAQPGSDAGGAAAQADHFVDVSGITSGNLLPVLDVEITNGLSASDMGTWVGQFLDRVYMRTGLHPMIYASPKFWRSNLGDTAKFAQEGSYLWVAHWTTAAAPSVPAGNWGGYGWTIWQYTDQGTAPGVAKAVDLDRFNGTDLGPIVIP